MRFFTLLVGSTSLLIAGCAAYFSVRGIGLLFAGFMVPVMIMAGSLEIGKLVSASFLYRRWNHIPGVLKFYLTIAVVMLVGITSLGIYGYLSDAFNKTSTRVSLYESNIGQLKDKNIYLKDQIESVNQAADTVDDKATEAIDNFQKIYDNFIKRQDVRKSGFDANLVALDKTRNDLEASSGGLFSNKKKKLADLAELQKAERASIKSALLTIDAENKEQYDLFLTKVENLRAKTGEVDVRTDVENYYDQIKSNEEEVLKLKELIGNTDIGSFKFIARTFNMELEQVVKWFMIIIVIVFDPLAVCLIIGYNSLLTQKERIALLKPEEEDSVPINTEDIQASNLSDDVIESSIPKDDDSVTKLSKRATRALKGLLPIWRRDKTSIQTHLDK